MFPQVTDNWFDKVPGVGRLFSYKKTSFFVCFLYDRFFGKYQAKKSLENNSTDLKKDLQSIYSEMEIAINDKNFFKFLDIDTKFHMTFFKYSNNKHLIRNYEKISSKIQALRFYVVKKALEDGQALRSHKIMLDAIINEDMEFFSENLHQHIISWLNKYKLDFKIGL